MKKTLSSIMPLIALVCLFSCNNAKTSKDELIEDKRDVTEISYTKYEEKKVAPDSFKSSLNEPWIKLKYQKDVFNDFQSSYANKLNEVDSLQSESVHVILINKEEKLNKFLTNEKLFRNLEALLIVNTKIDNSTFEKIIEALNSKKYFKKMILFNCEIREVPESIYKIEGLNTLDLAMNKIKELPKSITELKHLKYLRLSKNRRFKTLPDEIGTLSQLELLDFSGTSVESIPYSIGMCKNLKHITGNASKVKSIPPEIGNCISLKYINLGYNEITEIPYELGRLPLESLGLGNNLIETIPESISNLKDIWFLSLSNNKLNTFPLEVLELDKVVNLWLEGNDIKTIPVELADNKKLVSLIVDDREELKPFIEAIWSKNYKVKIKER